LAASRIAPAKSFISAFLAFALACMAALALRGIVRLFPGPLDDGE
jgi:hypothetical protein